MYYVNTEQIEVRLAVIPHLAEAAQRLQVEWSPDKPDLLHALAQERTLHLAIEAVTDIGSLMIDGFLMRDASSYEDIIDILHGEGVFGKELAEPLHELVRLRKLLVQDYMRIEREALNPLTARLPDLLPRFAQSVRKFIEKELS
jgi:uncharacterized protein YutE (UPF0331/DUF86 family)